MFDLELHKYNNNICLIDTKQTLKYFEVDNICNKLQRHLPKDKKLVLVQVGTNIETIIGYLVFLRMNYSFIMLDSSLNEELSNNFLDTYTPNYIWELKKLDFEYIISYGQYGLREYNQSTLHLHKNLSLLLSTSGSTGSPKIVKLTKKNLYANCDSIVEYLKINSKDRAITNLPLFYSYGLSVLNSHLKVGASIVISDISVMTKEFWELLKQKSVTSLNGVPYNYEIFKRIGITKMELPSLNYMTQAGGKLNPKLAKEYILWSREKGIKFFIMYGQTEATARISYVPIEKNLEKESSIGIVISNGELYIEDIKTKEKILSSNKEGELVYSGKNVMMGYAQTLTDLSVGDELQGKLYTGDVAMRDDENYFYITGRLKRFIKIHGNRVGLDEIEHYLKSLSFDILCTGIDNKLMIATKKEDLENIKKLIIEHYSFHHSVVKVKYVDEFPVTSSGKIEYQKLLKVFQ